MKQIFDQARLHAPTLLFIDEIDALCPRRDERVSSRLPLGATMKVPFSCLRSIFDRVEVM